MQNLSSPINKRATDYISMQHSQFNLRSERMKEIRKKEKIFIRIETKKESSAESVLLGVLFVNERRRKTAESEEREKE